MKIHHKIEDVDTCEIIIGNYWKIKPLMPFCGKRAFAVISKQPTK
jgi:hypothetical protein